MPNMFLHRYDDEDEDMANRMQENFVQLVGKFDGFNISVRRWFERYEKWAKVFQLDECERLFMGDTIFTGSALATYKTYFAKLQFTSPPRAKCTFEDMKADLVKVFDGYVRCLQVHQWLSAGRQKRNESRGMYLHRMSNLAESGDECDVDELSLVEYVVDGLRGKRSLNGRLFGARTMAELRFLLDGIPLSDVERSAIDVADAKTTDPKVRFIDVHRKLTAARQRPTESMLQYAERLRQLAISGNVDFRSMMSYIVRGLDGTVQEKMFLCTAKTFEELCWNLRAYEKCMRPLGGTEAKCEEKCENCGGMGHGHRVCPSSRRCFACHRVGHLRVDCDEIRTAEADDGPK